MRRARWPLFVVLLGGGGLAWAGQDTPDAPPPAAQPAPPPPLVEGLTPPPTVAEAPTSPSTIAEGPTPSPTVTEAPPPSPAVAEGPTAPPAATGGPSPSPDVLDAPPPIPDSWTRTDVTVGLATQVAGSVGFSGPIGAGASIRFLHGLAADVREDDGRVKAVCAVPIPHCAQGFTLEAAAGSGGGKLSLGVGARARVEEEDFNGTVGVGLRAALVRTWGSPIGTEPGLTYLGPELALSIIRVDVSLGVLWRVSGPGGKSVLFSWGLGIGL